MSCFRLINKWCSWEQSALRVIWLYMQSVSYAYLSYNVSNVPIMYPSGLFLNCTHDQMTILFLNICSFTAMKMGPMAYTMFKCAQHVPKCPTITVPSQYDQMAWLFFHIWSFTAMKMSSMAYKIYQSSFNILPSIKYPPQKNIVKDFEDFDKMAKFCKIWSHCVT